MKSCQMCGKELARVTKTHLSSKYCRDDPKLGRRLTVKEYVERFGSDDAAPVRGAAPAPSQGNGNGQADGTATAQRTRRRRSISALAALEKIDPQGIADEINSLGDQIKALESKIYKLQSLYNLLTGQVEERTAPKQPLPSTSSVSRRTTPRVFDPKSATAGRTENVIGYLEAAGRSSAEAIAKGIQRPLEEVEVLLDRLQQCGRVTERNGRFLVAGQGQR